MASSRPRVDSKRARWLYREIVCLIVALSCWMTFALSDASLISLSEWLRDKGIPGVPVDPAGADPKTLLLFRLALGLGFALIAWLQFRRLGWLAAFANVYSTVATRPPFLRIWSRADADQSTLDFRRTRYPYMGRAHELALLKAFALSTNVAEKTGDRFSWLWLKGEGGLGKSRLALELVYELSGQKSWRLRLQEFIAHPFAGRGLDCGFLDVASLEPLREWQVRKPVLIVLDDVVARSNSAAFLRELIQELHKKTKKAAIRLLIVERDQPVTFADQELIYQYREPLELLPLRRDDSIRIVYSVLHDRWARSSDLPPESLDRILEMGSNNPFWLLVAAEGYKESGGNVDLSDRFTLIEDRVKTYISRLAATYDLPSECHAPIFLATLTGGLSLASLDHDSTLFRCSLEGKDAYFRRLYGARGSNFIPPVTPDLFGCFYVLTYLDRFKSGVGLPHGVAGTHRVPSVEVSSIRQLAFQLNPEHAAIVVVQAMELGYRRDLLDLLDPPLDTANLGRDDTCWWLAVAAQYFTSQTIPFEKKRQRYEEIKRAFRHFPNEELCHQWLGLALAKYTQVLRSGFKKRAEKGSLSRTLGSDLEEVRFIVGTISQLCALHLSNSVVWESYSLAALAAFAFSANLGPSSVAVAQDYLIVLKHIAASHSSSASRALSQALVIAMTRKIGDPGEHLAAVRELSREDEQTTQSLALALVAAIYQRVGDPGEHFRELEGMASLDGSFLLKVAEARKMAVCQKIGDVATHLAELSKLAARNPKFQVAYAEALVGAISVTWGDLHEHLEKLKSMGRSRRADLRLLAEYANGLAALMKWPKRRTLAETAIVEVTHEDRLSALKELEWVVREAEGLPIERHVESAYAKALFQALDQELGDPETFLRALREYANMKKSDISAAQLAKALSIAIGHSKKEAAERYGKEFESIQSQTLSDDDALDILHGAAIQRYRTEISRKLGNFDEHLSRCIGFAAEGNVGKATASELVAGLASSEWLEEDSSRADRLLDVALGKTFIGKGKAQLLARLISHYASKADWTRLGDCRREFEKLCQLRGANLVTRDVAIREACLRILYLVEIFAASLAEESFWLVAKEQASWLPSHLSTLDSMSLVVPKSMQVVRSYYKVLALSIVVAHIARNSDVLQVHLATLAARLSEEPIHEEAAVTLAVTQVLAGTTWQLLMAELSARPTAVHVELISPVRLARAHLLLGRLGRHGLDDIAASNAVGAIRDICLQNPADAEIRSVFASALALGIEEANEKGFTSDGERLLEEFAGFCEMHANDSKIRSIYNYAVAVGSRLVETN